MSITKQKSLHGVQAFVAADGQLVGKDGLASGGLGKAAISMPSADRFTIFDDFAGPDGDTGKTPNGRLFRTVWGTVVGSDTGNDGELGVFSGSHGGALRMGSPRNFGINAAGQATDTVALVSSKSFSANRDFGMAAKVRINDTGSTPNGVSFFVGFSDDTGTIEFPIFVDTGADNDAVHGELTAVAADAVGWLFDTAGDTGSAWTVDTGDRRWHGVAADAGTVIAGDVGGASGASVLEAATGAVANKWDTLEIVYRAGIGNGGDTGGNAFFYLNGTAVGRIHSPVVGTAKLTPWIGIHGRGSDVQDTVAASVTADIDYVHYWANRDTGD
jgi:hypothetical protein